MIKKRFHMTRQNVLEVKNLKKVFKKGNDLITAVNNVSFVIREGECFSLIGESGSGKSTIANMIAGFMRCTEGEIAFCNNKLPEKPSNKGFKLRNKMQIIFQNPLSSFSPKMTLLKSISEGILYDTDLSNDNIARKVYDVLELVGLKKEYAGKYCTELSGGECQRAAIARAIISEPKLIICDECTSALDVSVQSQIISLLMRLKKELNLSYLFISHDIALVSNISDHIAVMKDGYIIEDGPNDTVIKQPSENYTRFLINNAKF